MIDRNDSFISVIMPAWNAEQTLAQSIQSVLRQTHGQWELLVVDDASTDRTPDILRRFATQDPRIRIFRNEQNMGALRSRNRAVREARGAWLAFLDSDDLWHPDKLARQLAFSERAQAQMSFTACAYINERGRPYPGVFRARPCVGYREMCHSNPIPHSSVMLRPAHYRIMERADHNIHEDYLMWLTIMRDGLTAYGLDEVLTAYRFSRSTKSGKKWNAARMHFRTLRTLERQRGRRVADMLHYGVISAWKYAWIFYLGRLFQRADRDAWPTEAEGG